MRKIMLLGIVAIMPLLSSAGTGSSAAKTEKNPVLIIDDLGQVSEFMPVMAEKDVILIASEASLENMAAVLIQDIKIEAENLVLSMYPTSAILPDPVGADPWRTSDFVAYKEKGQLKNKFHPKHLFHPVKLC